MVTHVHIQTANTNGQKKMESDYCVCAFPERMGTIGCDAYCEICKKPIK